MADEQRRRLWPWAAYATVTWALVVAYGVTAAWSLIAADPWDWGRFWMFFTPLLGGGLGSSIGQVMVRRGMFSSRPPVRSKTRNSEETAQVLRSGVLPPGADSEEWQLRVRRHLRKSVAIVAASTAFCFAAAVLTALAAHLTNHDDPELWAFAILLVVLPVPLLPLLVRVRRRGERLLARL